MAERELGRLATVVVSLALLAGCATSTADGGGALHGITLPTPYTAPTTELTDTSGQPFSLAADTRKPLTLVFFGYTHCPDICQVVMASLASAMTRLDPAIRSQVDVVFVTTDPARDDRATLRTYLQHIDPRFIGLTGDLPSVIAAGKALGVPVDRGQKLPSGGYEVVHGTQVVAIDAHDRSPIVWTQGTSAAQFAADITQLLSK